MPAPKPPKSIPFAAYQVHGDRFAFCAHEVLGPAEGGFTIDQGGPTWRGCSQRAHPDLWPPKAKPEDLVTYDMGPRWGERTVPADHVIVGLKHDYWLGINGEALPNHVDFLVFDYAYNSGTGRAARVLQRLVGAHPDGQIGSKTLEAVRRTIRAERSVAAAVLNERTAFLEGLAHANPDRHGASLNGWMNRLDRLWDFLFV